MIFRSTYNKPILLVGNGVRTSNSVDLAHKFAKLTNIPVLTTMNAVDIAQDDLHIGFIGTHGNRVANMILTECDLVISVGARLSIRQTGLNTAGFAPNADLVRVDIDEYELSRDVKQNETKYHTNARDFFELLMDENIGDYSKWRIQCQKAKEFLSKYDLQEGNLAIQKISSLLPINPVVALDVGMNQCWAAQSLNLKGYKGRILVGGGYGAMGCSLPYAIGSSIAMNKQPVFCICGDGGFQMNIQELETVKREELPIKIFILNNKVLGKISETQHFYHNDRFANTAASGGYSVPDFKKIADAYGIRSVSLSSYRKIEEYADWIDDNQPCLFDISLPEESFLTPKIKFESGCILPELDDAVYLEAKNLLAN